MRHPHGAMLFGRANDVYCEVLIKCAGQWERQFGRLAGVTVRLCSARDWKPRQRGPPELRNDP